MSDGVAVFARSQSLDADRVHVELVYLSILTAQFALGVALGTGESHALVGVVRARPLVWSAVARIGRRPGGPPPEYRTRSITHPELGRAM